MSDTLSTTHYRAPDGAAYRVRIEPDPDAESPRSYDNLTTLVTWDRSYHSPDGDATIDDLPAQDLLEGTNPARKLALYVATFRPDILAAVPLTRNYYSGSLSTTSDGASAIGVGYVTRDNWAKMMGESPTDGSDGLPTPRQAIDQDLQVYARWASGEYVGFVVERQVTWVRINGHKIETHEPTERETMTTWEETESCWGFDADDYALQEAVYTLPTGSVQSDPVDDDN